MKKVLTILLIAICCVSVFAVDMSGQVSMHLYFDKNGFNLHANENWEPVFTLSVAGDKAGAEFKFAPINFFETVHIETSIYYQPDDPYKITLGANSEYSISKGLENSSIMEYGKFEYNNDASNYVLKFGYRPNDDVLFASGLINQAIDGFGYIHADALAKLDLDGYKPSLNYALAELTYSNSLNPDNLIETGTYGKGFASLNEFDTEEFFFNSKTRSQLYDHWWNGVSQRLTAGLRYKYYTEIAKEKSNGLYGYGYICYNTGNQVFVEAEGEANLKLADFAFGTYFTVGAAKGMAYSTINMDLEDAKLSAKINEAFGWMTYAHNAITYRVQADYFNKDTNSAEENGFFVAPGIVGSIGKCGFDYYARLGIDSLKNFQWKVFTMNKVAF